MHVQMCYQVDTMTLFYKINSSKYIIPNIFITVLILRENVKYKVSSNIAKK